MDSAELLGRDITTVVTYLQGQLKTAQERASFENVARVLERARLSDYEPPQQLRGLELCADALLEYRRVMFYRIALTDPAYGAERLAEACGKIVEVLARENDPARPEPLPRVDMSKVDAQTFYKENLYRPRAVMLDNWGHDISRLQLDTLMKNYGDEPQPLLSDVDYKQYEGPLRDVAEKGSYLANSDRLLARHPELIGDLKAERFQAFGGLRYMSSQVFAGTRFGGSPAHFAVAPNLFYQIEGSKRWTLVDPAFNYFTYPVLNPIDGFTALYWMDEADGERCPLYRYCPRYYVDLKPGDLLFNPRYWQHSVVNLSKESVGVAVRWMEKAPETTLSPCALFDVARQLNPRRIETELHFMLSLIDGEQSAWFENHVHGRTYQYNPELIGRSWGVKPATVGQLPRFRDHAPSQ